MPEAEHPQKILSASELGLTEMLRCWEDRFYALMSELYLGLGKCSLRERGHRHEASSLDTAQGQDFRYFNSKLLMPGLIDSSCWFTVAGTRRNPTE